jgi:hypothetical protein
MVRATIAFERRYSLSGRLVFLMFQEPNTPLNIPLGSPEYGSTLEERRSWNALEFAERYGLKLVGINFFLLDATD